MPSWKQTQAMLKNPERLNSLLKSYERKTTSFNPPFIQEHIKTDHIERVKQEYSDEYYLSLPVVLSERKWRKTAEDSYARILAKGSIRK